MAERTKNRGTERKNSDNNRDRQQVSGSRPEEIMKALRAKEDPGERPPIQAENDSDGDRD